MFKKLRNKFMLLNLVIISALLLISFVVIYLITYENIDRAIGENLQRSAGMSMGLAKNRQSDQLPPFHPPEDKNAPNYARTFSVELDENKQISKVNSMLWYEDAFYTQLTEAAVKKGGSEGTLHLQESGTWAYRFIYRSDGLQVLAFMDIASELVILRNLIVTFLLVALISMGIIFLISLFFANRAIAPLEEAWEKQRRFVADASHELKTPLTTINTNVDVLLSHQDHTIGEEAKWLGYIQSEAQRMTKLTNELLYLAKVDASENTMLYSRTCFSDLAESILLTMEAVIYEKDIALDYHIAPQVFVYGNGEQLKQLVMILLDNAIKYTPNQGRISLNLTTEPGFAQLQVRNTGEGIKKEDMEHIFDRFYRADQSRARESGGHGLGLSIAHAIVHEHKGKIKVDSALGQWTCFKAEIPLAKEDA